jgi:hypothetical protein
LSKDLKLKEETELHIMKEGRKKVKKSFFSLRKKVKKFFFVRR